MTPTKPAKMRLSSGYVIECPPPCGAEFESFSRTVCCIACRREIVVIAPNNAIGKLDAIAFSVHQRAAWARVRFTG